MSAEHASTERFHQAVTLFHQGDIGRAQSLCRDILQTEPTHADALHLLGLAALRTGDTEFATDLLGRSVAINPNQPQAHARLGMALLTLKRPEAALRSFDCALELKPTWALASFYRATAPQELCRLDEALASYDRALHFQPDSVLALNNRGNVLRALGKPLEALASFDRALLIQPDFADALHGRGAALLELRRPAEALASFDRVLVLIPDSVPTMACRATALLELKRSAEALACAERALLLQPDFPEALNNRGNALRELRRREEALASYDRALQLRPDFVEALGNRGTVLWELKKLQEALASCEAALQIEPDFAAALHGCGVTLLALKRPEEALASLDRALQIVPDFALAMASRAHALLELKRAAEALTWTGRALVLQPDFPEALNNRGNALRELQRQEEALACYDRALQLQPDFAPALNSRGVTLLYLRCYADAARDFTRLVEADPEFEYGLGARFHCSLQRCDWADYQRDADTLIESVSRGKRVIDPFTMLAISDSPDVNLRCAQIYVASRFHARTPAWYGEPYRHERIRIAYVSPDLRNHVVAHLLAPLIRLHDRARFETIAISLHPPDSTPAGERIQAAFDRFFEVTSLTDAEVAALMRRLEIDIAVDVAGFTAGHRAGIFELRAAPVQVSYLGFAGSMGTDYIDYLVADSTVIPAESRSAYSEKVVHLPGCYQVNNLRPAPAPGVSRAGCGLPDSGFIFCCFNASFKLTPRVFDVWMRLLVRIGGSVLWLAGQQDDVVHNLRAAAAERGIEPHRLIFAQYQRNFEDHLARYALADLFLDTLPFNAHATAGDALWAGLPVLTCRGRAFAGRVASSYLRALGLPELITESLEDYEARAFDLATTPALLADIRAKLARNRTTHALFDTARFCRHLESAYVTMWERYQRGDPPEHFAVQAVT